MKNSYRHQKLYHQTLNINLTFSISHNNHTSEKFSNSRHMTIKAGVSNS